MCIRDRSLSSCHYPLSVTIHPSVIILLSLSTPVSLSSCHYPPQCHYPPVIIHPSDIILLPLATLSQHPPHCHYPILCPPCHHYSHLFHYSLQCCFHPVIIYPSVIIHRSIIHLHYDPYISMHHSAVIQSAITILSLSTPVSLSTVPS